MCGIVGFTGTQNAAPVLLDGLSKLESATPAGRLTAHPTT